MTKENSYEFKVIYTQKSIVIALIFKYTPLFPNYRSKPKFQLANFLKEYV